MNTNQNLSLWQIKSEYQNLLSNLYDYETGEVNMDVDAQLSAITTSAEEKCIAVASWIKNMESEKKQIEFMKEEIIRREAAFDKEIGKRTDYLKSNMEQLGITEVKCAYFTLRIKKNPYSTDITDEQQIPKEYMVTKEVVKKETKPDKNKIKEEVLKTGVQIPGTQVLQKTKLEILTDKI